MGFADQDVAEASEDIRRRDEVRLSEQVQGDQMSSRDRLILTPEPLTAR